MIDIGEQGPDRLKSELEKIVEKYHPKFTFAIFDRGQDRAYADWKSIMDHAFGIPSQGLLNQTVDKNPRGCMDNILYKVNVKCGGEWILAV